MLAMELPYHLLHPPQAHCKSCKRDMQALLRCALPSGRDGLDATTPWQLAWLIEESLRSFMGYPTRAHAWSCQAIHTVNRYQNLLMIRTDLYAVACPASSSWSEL